MQREAPLAAPAFVVCFCVCVCSCFGISVTLKLQNELGCLLLDLCTCGYDGPLASLVRRSLLVVLDLWPSPLQMKLRATVTGGMQGGVAVPGERGDSELEEAPV